MGKSMPGRATGARSRAVRRCSWTMTARWSDRADAGRGAGRRRAAGAAGPAASERLGGALAIVSGRAGRRHRRLLAPLRLTVAGLHGLELRPARLPDGRVDGTGATGCWHRRGRRSRSSRPRYPGTLLEDKRLSLALHYRLAPEAAAAAEQLAERLAAESAGALRLQRGKMVVELLPAGRDKGRAIDDLLRD